MSDYCWPDYRWPVYRWPAALALTAALLAPAAVRAEAETAPPAGPALSAAAAERVEARFLAALQAIDAGAYQDAIDLLDAILEDHPDLLRVRLELARALFLKGDEDIRAQFQFERVLGGDLPEAVRLNIGRFLSAIRARRSWTLTAGLALVPDSNINSGPSSREVTIGGLPFQLSDQATEQSGLGLQFSLGGSYRLPLAERWRLQMGGLLFHKTYDQSRFNDSIAQWSIGPRRLFERGEIGLAFVGYHRLYGDDPYATAAGFRLDGNNLLTDRLRLEAGLQYRDIDYHKADDLDGGTLDLDLTLRHAVTPTLLAYATALYSRTDARRDSQDSEARGLALGAYADFGAGISLGLSARFTVTEYEGLQPLFGRQRRDTEWQESIVLLHRGVKILGATPNLRYTRVDHDSTISAYAYPRNLFEIGLTREF